jgi:hypothetical protein
MTIAPYDCPLKVRVAGGNFTIVAPTPATVTQRTVEQHFGIPPRTYRRMVREGAFPTKKVGRLIFAAYDDVRRAVTSEAQERGHAKSALQASNANGEMEPPPSLRAAREYVDTAPTRREKLRREREIASRAWAIMAEYDEKLDDGSPNPKRHKSWYDHGMNLWLTAVVGGPVKTSTGIATAGGGPTPGQGHYRKCCWCDRPAYATKQTWNEKDWYWCGGPVCEVCAKSRASNERVVQLEGQKILLPARDPTVPTEWHRPRRRRRGN